MRHGLLFLILLVTLAGCTAKVAKTGEVGVISDISEPVVETEQPSLPQPQITSSTEAIQQAGVNTATSVEVTKAPEESLPTEQNATAEPQTYYVNVVEAIGIREGA